MWDMRRAGFDREVKMFRGGGSVKLVFVLFVSVSRLQLFTTVFEIFWRRQVSISEQWGNSDEKVFNNYFFFGSQRLATKTFSCIIIFATKQKLQMVFGRRLSVLSH